MKHFFLLQVLLSTWILTQAQHPNILISNQFDPNEPSISIDPKQPNRLVAGANLNNVYTSSDTGRTWTQAQMSSPYGVWGDPTLAVDTSGNFYFFHLSNPNNGSWIDRIVCQKSLDGGQNWSNGTYTGLNSSKNQDKQWVAIDPASNAIYMTWTEFDKYGSNNPQDSSRILFSKSLDGGENWSVPQKINNLSGDCHDSDNTAEGAVPCVGPNGELYVVWTGPAGLRFNRSLDGGDTWLPEDIKIGDFPGGWDYDIPGLQRCNGLPAAVCDLSNGPNRGTIYINWSDQRNGPNDTNIWLAKSTDGGNTWSAPARVNNDPPGKHQFLTWMAIDQQTGFLWFVFYDRRNYSNAKTDVFMAVSKDGGLTFNNFKISESPFTPSDSQFFGDYSNITASGNIVRPIWTRMDGTKTSVWTAIVNVNETTGATEPKKDDAFKLESNYPNPASGIVWIPFKIRRSTTLSLQVIDLEGVVLKTIFSDRTYEYGKYTEEINLKELGLPAGTYWIVLKNETGIFSKKMVILP